MCANPPSQYLWLTPFRVSFESRLVSSRTSSLLPRLAIDATSKPRISKGSVSSSIRTSLPCEHPCFYMDLQLIVFAANSGAAQRAETGAPSTTRSSWPRARAGRSFHSIVRGDYIAHYPLLICRTGFMPTELTNHREEGFTFKECPVSDITQGRYSDLDPECLALIENSKDRMPWRLYVHQPYTVSFP
jgi:hypothetical protein